MSRSRKRQGVPLRSISGTVQNDILKEYVARGTYIYPPRASLRIVTDIFAFCDRELPNWNTISISGYHIREAGSTAVQEVAFTFANAIAYVQAAIDAGLDVNRFGQRLSFFFNAHNDFLEEIAKFRAARRLWAHIMRDRFGATNPRAQQLRFHTQTAGSTLTAQQPDNNIVRVALQALAAGHWAGRSRCTATDATRRWRCRRKSRRSFALRTQQVIAAETGVANTVDPCGGAYAIEETDRSNRTRRTRAARSHRRGGRNAGGHRARPDPARDPGIGVPRPAGDRPRRADRRRRQPVRVGRADADRGARDRRRISSGGRSTASAPFVHPATRPPGAHRSRRSRPPQAAQTISCRWSSTPSRRARRSAKSPTRCASVLGEHKEIDV